jgi:hypothetical protein
VQTIVGRSRGETEQEIRQRPKRRAFARFVGTEYDVQAEIPLGQVDMRLGKGAMGQ